MCGPSASDDRLLVVHEARVAANEIVEHFLGLPVAKAMNLGTRARFDRAVALLAARLRRATARADADAVREAIAVLDVDWSRTTAAERRRLVAEAMAAAGRATAIVPTRIEGRSPTPRSRSSPPPAPTPGAGSASRSAPSSTPSTGASSVTSRHPKATSSATGTDGASRASARKPGASSPAGSSRGSVVTTSPPTSSAPHARPSSIARRSTGRRWRARSSAKGAPTRR